MNKEKMRFCFPIYLKVYLLAAQHCGFDCVNLPVKLIFTSKIDEYHKNKHW